MAEAVGAGVGVAVAVAIGVAVGTSSHAAGTTTALQMGELEGAMSGVSIGVAGLLTVLLAAVW